MFSCLSLIRVVSEATLFPSNTFVQSCDLCSLQYTYKWSACPNRPGTLHDFRSHEIADQLTLLDAELFYKIEVPWHLCVSVC